MIPGKAGRKEGALARDFCSVSSAVRCSSCLLSSDLWNHPFLKSHLVTPDPGTSFFLLPPFSHLSYPSSSPSPPPSVLELRTDSLPSIFRVSMPHLLFHLLRLPLHSLHRGGRAHFTGWDGENGIMQRFKAEEILELRCAVLRWR